MRSLRRIALFMSIFALVAPFSVAADFEPDPDGPWINVDVIDLVDYGKLRYNLLGNAADWFPGQSAAPDNLNPVRKDLQSLFRGMPSGERLMSVIEEAHQILFSEPEARLSQSD